MTDKQKVMNVVRDALIDINKPQYVVAGLLGVGRQCVSYWANGKDIPKVTHLIALMRLTSDPEGFMVRLVSK